MDRSISTEQQLHRLDYSRYRDAWNVVTEMIASKSYNLKDSVYTIESAVFTDQMTYEEYNDRIEHVANIIHQAMEQEGFESDNILAKKMMLHRYMFGIIEIYNENGSPNIRTRPIQYDFNDPLGHENIQNRSVLKLIETNKGQCRSMPLFYLIMAEELGFDAWLSLAPNHSFVKVGDNEGNLLNLELTNGHYTSDQFMMQSGYISTESILNRTFLDTLTASEILQYCLADLQMYYIHKYGYQPYLQEDIENLVLSNPRNISALLTLSNYATVQCNVEAKRLGYPRIEDITKHDRLHELYIRMHSIYQMVDRSGYSPMPLDQYIKWLESFNESNKKPIIKS